MDKKVVILILIAVIVFIFWGYNHTKNKIKKEEKTMKVEDVVSLQNWNDSDGDIYRDLKYKDGLTYNLYVPTNIDKSKSQAIMLFLHGGSWESGSKEDMDQVYCKIFTKAGYITAAMNYSFVNDNGTVTFNDILDEITACFEAIKLKGNELEINIDKASIAGFSAGAHLSLLYSYSRKDECPMDLKFVASQSAPTDFHKDSWPGYSDEFLMASLLKYSGVKVTDLNSELTEKTINSISPLSLVNKNVVPTIISQGTADTLVFPIHYQKLVKALEENGVKYDLLEFVGSDHFLFADTKMELKFYAKVLEYAREYFN